MGNARVLRHLPRSLKPPRPDRTAMARAVDAFLCAAGVDRRDPNLRETADRVAEAFAEEFLAGYGQSPEEALGELYPVPAGTRGELVIVTGLRFRSMCPHHLLPYEGIAHLAYVPKEHVVGFGRLARLLECFAHRLMLQEELARQVASALGRLLRSPGAACVISAEQGCLRLRGPRQRDAQTHAEAYEGVLRRNGPLRRELWARIRTGGVRR